MACQLQKHRTGKAISLVDPKRGNHGLPCYSGCYMFNNAWPCILQLVLRYLHDGSSTMPAVSSSFLKFGHDPNLSWKSTHHILPRFHPPPLSLRNYSPIPWFYRLLWLLARHWNHRLGLSASDKPGRTEWRRTMKMRHITQYCISSEPLPPPTLDRAFVDDARMTTFGSRRSPVSRSVRLHIRSEKAKQGASLLGHLAGIIPNRFTPSCLHLPLYPSGQLWYSSPCSSLQFPCRTLEFGLGTYRDTARG